MEMTAQATALLVLVSPLQPRGKRARALNAVRRFKQVTHTASAAKPPCFISDCNLMHSNAKWFVVALLHFELKLLFFPSELYHVSSNKIVNGCDGKSTLLCAVLILH